MQIACPKKLFLLTGVSACLSKPESQVTVLLRPVTTLNNRNGPFIVDGTKFSKADQVSFCKRYSIQTFNFTKVSTDIEDIEQHICDTITSLYSDDGLILIGGYQSSVSTVDLVLFKEDAGTNFDNFIDIKVLNFENDQWGLDDS